MSAPIAIWDWEREPQPPSARVVVCRPGLDSPPGSARWDWTWDSMFKREGQRFVLPYDPARLPRPLPSHIIPALYAEDNAGLAGVGALLAVQVDRRALVLCPREALDVKYALAIPHPRMVEEDPHAAFLLHEGMRDGTADGPRLVDIVVIIPPPEAGRCEACRGSGWRPIMNSNDGSSTCYPCLGSGRIEPWPLHPAWVRGVVEQCRAAGVSVVFLGWGEWCPISDTWPPPPNGTEERSVWRGAEGDPNDLPLLFYRVGTERAGRTLNDDEVMDLPEWLT